MDDLSGDSVVLIILWMVLVWEEIIQALSLSVILVDLGGKLNARAIE